MKVLVTGAHGFVGQNLIVWLEEAGHETIAFGRETPEAGLPALVAAADAVVHLAGENRPADPAAFDRVNRGLTERLARCIGKTHPPPPVFLASSTQAGNGTPYGDSKIAGEGALEAIARTGDAHATIVRFPNIFGKWCRPNYNSAVATFAYNAARGLPLPVNDLAAPLRLIYVDDVVMMIMDWVETVAESSGGVHRIDPEPVYETTVGDVAERMRLYAQVPDTLTVDAVGTGLARALYATFVSYLPPERFSYPLIVHADSRGRFAEMLRTTGAGQISFFTAGEGVTRGGHYHHTKSEKFLVVHGRARFRFRHLLTGEEHAIETSADEPRVVDTIPGWSHEIANVGDGEMIVVLWANEAFDRQRPDTVAASLEPLG